jgi:endonuclease/exonuclease/phosphatase family metal-dependent hydrolase
VDARPLRVLSYNIHGQAHLFDGRYLERIARVIRDVKPDVVGLQEVHRGHWKARRTDQAETLGRLTGMSSFFGPSFEEGGGAFGNAVLTAGEFLATEVVPLAAPGEPRTLLTARIALPELPVGEIAFHVTHLAAWGRWGRPARSLQSTALLRRLEQSNGPFVLVGDLNAVPGAPELGPLMAGEVFRMCGDARLCTHRVLRQRIDYVFADPGWTPVREEVVREGPSDHWPVLVELLRGGAE